MTFIHSFMRDPAWVREDFLSVAALAILGWVIIGLAICFAMRLFKKLTNRNKETQK